MFIIKLLSQQISGIIIPHHQENKTVYYCIRCSALVVLAVVVCSWAISCVHCVNSKFHTEHTAYDPAPHNQSQHNQCRTPYALIYSLDLLRMGKMMPETWWDRSLIINTGLVASCWFISLHRMFHDARSQEPNTWLLSTLCEGWQHKNNLNVRV